MKEIAMTSTESFNRERVVRVQNGWIVLMLLAVAIAGNVAGNVLYLASYDELTEGEQVLPILLLMLTPAWTLLVAIGFFSLEPNEARVLVLFGAYKGTVRESGFHWGNPFYSNRSHHGTHDTAAPARKTSGKPEAPAPARRGPGRHKISLRARTFNVDKLKVNDSRGNPIEIGAVVVWRVRDTAQAMFDVDEYENYVTTQSESALRHLANQYAYDQGEESEITLRSNVDEVSLALRAELDERLKKAGVVVDEARLTHLAYAPEIAQAMLRRQQAEAVIAARSKIVHGAVSMVHMALQELAEKGVVQLDDERRAAMVSNLMVVLCGESEVHPVVNAGTLYN
jgi:regulator of protease activity HflC (stomatin/prohibitin superfamily)